MFKKILNNNTTLKRKISISVYHFNDACFITHRGDFKTSFWHTLRFGVCRYRTVNWIRHRPSHYTYWIPAESSSRPPGSTFSLLKYTHSSNYYYYQYCCCCCSSFIDLILSKSNIYTVYTYVKNSSQSSVSTIYNIIRYTCILYRNFVFQL